MKLVSYSSFSLLLPVVASRLGLTFGTDDRAFLRSSNSVGADFRDLQPDDGNICNLQGTSDCETAGRPCNGFDVEFCNVNCVDACQEAEFLESSVSCQGEGSCKQSTFRNSSAYCSSRQSCGDAQFFSSAIDCNVGGYLGSCYDSIWFQCNCCLSSENCPAGQPLCVDPQTGTSDEFCSRSYLGRTCKDWGNPVCDEVQVASLEHINPASTCSAGEDIVDCEASVRPCTDFGTVDSCSMNCIDACQNIDFRESLAVCYGKSSCKESTFRNSTAYCWSRESCGDAIFFSSAIDCNVGGYLGSCYESIWFQCNCCLSSENCPPGQPLCVDPQTGTSEEFCSRSYLGRTCKDWGNPVCDEVQVTSLEPQHPASTCSVGEDIVDCETSVRPCTDFGTVDSCSVNCIDACQNIGFRESQVVCYGKSSCKDSTFRNSTAYCWSRESCGDAQFYSSAIACNVGGYLGSCFQATWFQCNCCLSSENCPPGLPLCVNPQTGTSDEFCNTVFEGRTCKDWGNPICQDPSSQTQEPVDVSTGTPSTILPTPPQTDPPTEPNLTDPPTDPPSVPPTDPPTEPNLTDPPTDPPSVPSTDPPINPPTDPPTDATTEPPTEPPTDPPTDATTEPPTDPPTDPPTGPPTDDNSIVEAFFNENDSICGDAYANMNNCQLRNGCTTACMESFSLDCCGVDALPDGKSLETRCLTNSRHCAVVNECCQACKREAEAVMYCDVLQLCTFDCGGVGSSRSGSAGSVYSTVTFLWSILTSLVIIFPFTHMY